MKMMKNDEEDGVKIISGINEGHIYVFVRTYNIYIYYEIE